MVLVLPPLSASVLVALLTSVVGHQGVIADTLEDEVVSMVQLSSKRTALQKRTQQPASPLLDTLKQEEVSVQGDGQEPEDVPEAPVLSSVAPTPRILTGSLFNPGWQNEWVPTEFRSDVAGWGAQSQCKLDLTYTSISPPSASPTSSPASVRQLSSTVEKHVKVEVPKIQIKQVPVYINLTQTKLVYKPSKKTIVRNVETDVVKKVEQIVEVPHMRDVVRVIRTVEVPEVVDIIQDVIIFEKKNKTVERQVEVPKIRTIKREVQVPQYKEVLREVPKIEIRQRTVEIIKEELELEEVEENVTLVEEQIAEGVKHVDKSVTALRETADVIIEEVEVPSNDIHVEDTQVSRMVNATETTKTTQEVLEVEEVIEYVEKEVEVVTERIEIVEVPKYVTKQVIKEVELWTTREEIVQISNAKTIKLIKQVPETILENLTVDLKHTELVPQINKSLVDIVSETVLPKSKTQLLETVRLVPEPYAVSEAWQNTTLKAESASTSNLSTQSSVADLTEEIIVRDVVEVVKTQELQVPVYTTQTVEVFVPTTEIEETIVKVPRVKEEQVIIEKCKIIDVERVIEVKGEEKPDLSFLGFRSSSEFGLDIYESTLDGPQINESSTDRSQASPSASDSSALRNASDVVQKKSTVSDPAPHSGSHKSNHTLSTSKAVDPIFTGSDKSKSTTNASKGSDDCDTTPKVAEEIRTVKVPVPNYVNKTVIVPVYEIIEVEVEVPKETVVEEVVEVPVVVEVEKVVEVLQIQYNDTVVEKVVKKRVKQRKQSPERVTRQKLVSKEVEQLSLKEDHQKVPVKVQMAKTVPSKTNASRVTEVEVLNLQRQNFEHVRKKKVQVTKRVEKLVPKMVERVVKKEVEVVKEVYSEKVVPIYKERVKQKPINVDTYSVETSIVPVKMRWQAVQTRDVAEKRTVALTVQEGVLKNSTKEVEVLSGGSHNVKTVKVPVPVPCTRG
eukprot:TRINITY_DN18533_c0_g1_i1.p1 TRINITY_DN18533_c0_g1~~TRINITY_DN18533_c0_g1_i1.p1  ORF type:complete len:957 (-),score=216.18 TRINITY_DN18533_c0_g1_i1:384-3254(-)